MVIINSIAKMLVASRKLRQAHNTVGFVPTMGALHEGHLSLIRRARRDNDTVVVSIFVNPVQFGPREDYRRYPRNCARDAALCRKAGADILFFPDVRQMYPEGFRTFVTVEGLSRVFCGAFRPGHFRGVATVVMKLFNIVGPVNAYFGQKDAQQAVIIKKMVADLNIGVRIKVMPTIRESDGLAMSSRNSYLSVQERKDAQVVPSALKAAQSLIKSGATRSDRVIRAMRKLILTKEDARIDYLSVVNPGNLEPLHSIRRRCLVMAAVWIGKIRLIDNMSITTGKARPQAKSS